MDSIKTDLQILIELANAAAAVMKTDAAKGNMTLQRTVKATAKHASHEIRVQMKGVEKWTLL